MKTPTELSDALHANLQNFAIPTLSAALGPFLIAQPYWGLAFYSVIGLYGLYIAANRLELEEEIKFIKDHPDEFREEIVQSNQFRKGFLQFTESFLKERLQIKKEMLKSIFLRFTSSPNKDTFELERLNDTLQRISSNALKLLALLHYKIIPVMQDEISSELKQKRYENFEDRSVEWWRQQMQTERAIWDYIHKWIYENYDTNSETVKKEYGLKKGEEWDEDRMNRAGTRKKDVSNSIHESITELVTLGIMSVRSGSTSYSGGTATSYSMTRYGFAFLDMIKAILLDESF